jgi:hypothetical protein
MEVALTAQNVIFEELFLLAALRLYKAFNLYNYVFLSVKNACANIAPGSCTSKCTRL